MKITKAQVARYVFLPEVVPRIKSLALDLSWLAYLMALIFAATRILPANHPYLARSQQGKYGLSDILFEAGKNIKGGTRHIDQYIIYGSFVLGILLLLGQFVILAFIIATHTADAATGFRGMFITHQPENDMALMMLDKVFEIPDMFGSKFNPTSVGGITPFAAAMHAMVAFYNYGMLAIAGLIVFYYIFAVTIETLQTGTPFGERFQEVFVPFRLVIAIALLLPLGYGFSAGQMLVLKLASWGSAFATNGWILFNARAKINPLGSGAAELVVSPKTEQIGDLIRFYSLVQSCRAIYKIEYGKEIKPYAVYDKNNSTTASEASSLGYDQALGFFGDRNLKVTFGELKDTYTRYPGKVKPYCGTIDIPVADSKIASAKTIQEVYWNFLQSLWFDQNLVSYGKRMANNFAEKTNTAADSVTVDGWDNPATNPDVGFYGNVRTVIQARFNTSMAEAKNSIRDDPDSNLEMTEDVLERGWGGAGIWFNKIAEYNGAVMSASSSVPVPSSYPAAMNWIMARKRDTDSATTTSPTRYTPAFGNGAVLTDVVANGSLDESAKDGQIVKFLGDIYGDMSEDNTYSDGTESHEDNILAKTFNMIFGTNGLFELRGNDQIHPLAKMSALGRSILDRAITYIGGAMVMGGLGGLSSLLDNGMGLSAQSGSLQAAFSGFGSMFVSFATIGITVGVVLYYVIPFLPFLYFFFAVGRWVKAVFEAIIGIPLWALAHLRIDGEGIPGPAAAQGYYLLLEILLRPILVIIGLMAAVSTFSALAITLDTLFDLVVMNVTGYTPIDKQGAYSFAGKEFKRGYVDQFFYTVVYAVLLYLMALSCFKLIDLIPNSVLRFIGTGVAEFNDQLNLEQDMIRYVGLSSYSMSDDVAKSAKDLGEIAGQGAALPGNIMMEMNARMPKGEPPAAAPQQPAPSGGGRPE